MTMQTEISKAEKSLPTIIVKKQGQKNRQAGGKMRETNVLDD